MRTKVLLCAAALAASLASSMAQNVYSLNVVGYVNVTLPAGQFYGVANPLDASMGGTVAGGNDAVNLFTSATTGGTLNGGSTIATFNSAAFDYDLPITYFSKSGTWAGPGTPFAMPPGKGALFFNGGGTPTVVTFVGQVQQGSYNVATLGASQFTLIGMPVPLTGDQTVLNSQLGLASQGGDSVTTFDSTAFDWKLPVSFFSKSQTWNGSMPIAPGQAALYLNGSGTPNAWVSNFTVQ